MVVFGHIGCIPAKGVLFRARWFYLRKVVVIGRNRLYSGKSGLITTKWLYSGKTGCAGEN